MSQQVVCPLCSKAVQYTPQLAGQTVVCPHCNRQFQMPQLGGPQATAPPPRKTPTGGPAGAAPLSIGPAREDTGGVGVGGGAPIITTGGPPGIHAGPTAGAGQTHRKGVSTAAARKKLQLPGIFVAVCGALGLLSALGMFGRGAIYASKPEHWQAYFLGPNADGIIAAHFIAGGICLLVMAAVCYGAMQMMSLQDYGMAKLACILLCIPIFGCCVFSLPFGIWGIVTLNNPEVRRAFRRGGGGSVARRYR